MSKNILPIVLIVLAIGIYFTFTSGQIEAAKEVQEVNARYDSAIVNARKLVSVRDSVLKSYNSISDDDRIRLEKMLPDNIDNVRLIIDVNSIGTRHGVVLRNVHTSANDTAKASASTGGGTLSGGNSAAQYNTVSISFSVSTTYENFISLLQDMERSLRIMDISSVSLNSSDNGVYDYGVEIKTYWLKQ